MANKVNTVKLTQLSNYPVSKKEIENLFRGWGTLKEIRERLENVEAEIIFDSYLRINTGNIYKGNTTKTIVDASTLKTIANKMSRKDIFINAISNYVKKGLEPLVQIQPNKTYIKVLGTEIYSVYKDEYVISGNNKVSEVKGTDIINTYKKAVKDKDFYRMKITGQGILFNTIPKDNSERYNILYKPK